MKSKIERNINLDLLKIVACVMVITIHVTATNLVSGFAVGTLAWRINLFFNVLSRAAVPLFMMVSGKLILAKNDAPSVKELFDKYIFRIFKIYIFWSLFYSLSKILIIGINAPITESVIFDNILPHYHLWYLAALIGVYFVLPLLFAIRDYRDGEYLKYFVYIFVFFGIIKFSLMLLPYGINDYVMFIPKFIDLISYPLVEYSGYFLLGYYLGNIKWKISKFKLLLIFILTILVAFKTIDYLSIKQGYLYHEALEYFTVFTFIEATVLFKLFQTLDQRKLKDFTKQLIVNISSLTLGIYIIHAFVIEEIIPRLIFIKTNNMLIFVPVMVAIVFTNSTLITLLIKNIKIINKYIS